MTDSFISYKHFRWLRWNALLVLIVAMIYYMNDPLGGRSGSTWVGYGLGFLSTAAIIYLMWFGIRKRAHYAQVTTLKGCLAVHVWLGLALGIIVPFHAGFQFGLNVHTLAYALMMATIFSGVVGAVIYIRYPSRMQSHRGGGTIKNLLEQIGVISADVEFLAKDRGDEFLRLFDRMDFIYKPSVAAALIRRSSAAPVPPRDIAALLSKLPKNESDEGYQLVSLTTKKRQLVTQIESEIRTMAAFRTWLYFHLPLSFAMLAALSIHIFSVFYYR